MKACKRIPIAAALILAVSSIFLPAPGRALCFASRGEVPEIAPSDSLPPADSIPADSLPADSISNSSSLISNSRNPRPSSPVIIDDKAPRQPSLHYYDKHGNALPEPVRFLLDTDTVKKADSGPKFPLFSGVDVGLNFFDAIMALAGQKHQSFDVWASINLHNWFFPTVEFGLGRGHDAPEDRKFVYDAKLSPFFKIGLDYNFLYKSNPDYRLFFGIRAGMSTYKYDITDITLSNDYWGESQSLSILNQKATSIFGEVLAGLKVKVYKRFSMGWTFRYHFNFHTAVSGVSAGNGLPGSTPWFIPGYGASTPISFTYSLIWTFGPMPQKEIEN